MYLFKLHLRSLQEKQGIKEVSWIHPLMTMNMCTKFYGHPVSPFPSGVLTFKYLEVTLSSTEDVPSEKTLSHLKYIA